MATLIPEKLDKRFDVLAKQLGKSKNLCVRKALTQYLEDQEDLLLAKKIMAEDDGTRYSWDDVKKELNLKP